MWKLSVSEHSEILAAVRSLAPAEAQQFVENAIRKFRDDMQRYLIEQGD